MLHILHGPNTFESWKEKETLITNFKKKYPQGSTQIYELETLESSDVSFSSLDIFTNNQKKLYIIKRFFQLKKTLLEKYSLDLVESQDTIILWEDRKIDKRSKIYKNLSKKAHIQEFKEIKNYEVVRWIKKQCASLKITLSEKQITEISFFFGNNQWLIDTELKKIKLFLTAKKQKSITDKAFKYLVSYSNSEEIWSFIENFFKKNKTDSINYVIHKVSNVSDASIIIGSIAWQLRIMLILLYSQNNSQELVCKQYKIHPFVAKKTNELLKLTTIEKCTKLYEQLSNLDYSIKTGKIDPLTGLSFIIASY